MRREPDFGASYPHRSSRPPALAAILGEDLALSPEALAVVEALPTEVREVEPRRKLIDAGRLCPRIFVLLDGWLIQSKTLRDGRRQILHLQFPGAILGLERLAGKVSHHATETLTRCSVAALPLPAVTELLEQPVFASALLLWSLRAAAIPEEWEVNLGRRAAFSRVGHLFLEIRRRLDAAAPAEEPFAFPLTQQEIADCTGLTTPYVNRILREMRSRRLIRLENHVLQILDPRALAKAAEFSPEYL